MEFNLDNAMVFGIILSAIAGIGTLFSWPYPGDDTRLYKVGITVIAIILTSCIFTLVAFE